MNFDLKLDSTGLTDCCPPSRVSRSYRLTSSAGGTSQVQRNIIGELLLGLYQGVPLTERGAGYFGVLPDRIVLFRRPIEHRAESRVDLEALVLTVVVFRKRWFERGPQEGRPADPAKIKLRNDVLPELEKASSPSPAISMPRSPCAASTGWT